MTDHDYLTVMAVISAVSVVANILTTYLFNIVVGRK